MHVSGEALRTALVAVTLAALVAFNLHSQRECRRAALPAQPQQMAQDAEAGPPTRLTICTQVLDEVRGPPIRPDPLPPTPGRKEGQISAAEAFCLRQCVHGMPEVKPAAACHRAWPAMEAQTVCKASSHRAFVACKHQTPC